MDKDSKSGADRLGDAEIGVYRWAVGHGGLDPAGAASALGLDGADVRRAGEVLLRMGLLREVAQGPGQQPSLVPVAPGTAAAGLLAPAEAEVRERVARLQRMRGEFELLESVYAQSRREHGAVGAAEEVLDLPTVIGVIHDLVSGCRDEILSCEPHRDRPPELLERAYASDLELLERGVRMRALYQSTARHHAPSRDHIDRIVAAGTEVRTLGDLFGRMMVFDRRVALLPHHEHLDGAVVVRDGATVAALSDVFEHAWRLATPYRPGRQSAPEIADEAKLAIVRLLVEGMKDEVIARRLGMSLRTCRRHIGEIMERFGADSRFQAGYLIAARLNGGPDGAPHDIATLVTSG